MYITGDLKYELEQLELAINKDVPPDQYLQTIFDILDMIVHEFDLIQNEILNTGDVGHIVKELDMVIDDDMDREQIRAALHEKIADVRHEINRMKG